MLIVENSKLRKKEKNENFTFLELIVLLFWYADFQSSVFIDAFKNILI